MNLKSLIIAVLVTFTIQLIAQDNLTKMFWAHRSLYTPSTVGLDYNHKVDIFGNANHLPNHKDFPNSPNLFGVQYELKIPKISSGIGFTYVRNGIGYETRNSVRLNYAYHYYLSDTKIISAGVYGEFIKKTIDFPRVNSSLEPDPIIASTTYAGLGISYKADKFFVGAGMYPFFNDDFMEGG